STLKRTRPNERVRTSLVDAGVAEGGVQQPDHGDRVAADVHRDVHRNLDDVAGRDARGVHGGTLGTRVGDGQARTRENQTTSGSRSSDDLLDHYSSLLAMRSKIADHTTGNEEGVMRLRAYGRIHSSRSIPDACPITGRPAACA